MLQKVCPVFQNNDSIHIFKVKLKKPCRSQQVNEVESERRCAQKGHSLVIFRRASCQGDFPVGNRVADAGGICIAEAHRNS